MTTEVIDAVDVAAYFDRIGYRGPAEPTVETVRALVAAHNGAIPFENLDPLMGVPVADLSAAALSDKLVGRRRGGDCYEHNGLMGFVLEQLGYEVDRLAGRVVWMSTPGAPLPAQTHNVLAVTVPGVDGRYLVDVGFGGQTPSSPLRLEAGPVQNTRHEPYRLVKGGLLGDNTELTLEALLRDEWRPLYVFSTRPQPRIDLEVGSWYVSTRPASIFVKGLSVSLVTDEERWNLRGRNLAVHRDGNTERTRFDTAAEVLDELAGRFGLNLDDVGDRGA